MLETILIVVYSSSWDHAVLAMDLLKQGPIMIYRQGYGQCWEAQDLRNTLTSDQLEDTVNLRHSHGSHTHALTNSKKETRKSRVTLGIFEP